MDSSACESETFSLRLRYDAREELDAHLAMLCDEEQWVIPSPFRELNVIDLASTLLSSKVVVVDIAEEVAVTVVE